MADKTYYWIKLKMDFFKSLAVRLLRKMSGGDTYTLIYLELILLSLDNNGYIYFTGIGRNFAEELAVILDEETVDVEFLLSFLNSKKLIEFSDENANAFKFADDVTEGLIGKETSSAKRIRAWRARQKELQSNAKSLQSSTDVTSSNTEKELDKETDKDTEEVRSTADAEQFDWQAVISYLNQETGKHYRNTDSNKRVVLARHKEGFSFEDMKTVIDNQCREWLNKPKMIKYLRPETLFRASKFEGYLNNTPQQPRQGGWFD